ncbi:ParA family protein [Spiroplasma endosymbiont of Lariophagus distinguendus]|uniref:ParA family protein n=1 Tax=Spiroplasma endosymbiont of Lariophagus distinguendus TaxID=2935082 RepID=UPI00207A205B|nr:ParA family protein [Spiroplasma endosymbiont of Lariophagus distinguendus]
MKIITVCNFKGGVGKTTLITGFARILSQSNFSVLLIDLDPQANLTSVFRKNKNNNIGSEQWFKTASKTNEDNLISTIEISNEKNISLIPTNSKLDDINRYLSTTSGREFVLKKNIKKCMNYLMKKFDYILIDTNPSLNDINISALVTADDIVLVTEPHRFSISGTIRVKDIWTEICDNLEIKNNLNTIILNKVNKSMARQNSKNHLYEKYENLLCKNWIPFTANIDKSTMLNNINITEKNPFVNLTNELIQRRVFNIKPTEGVLTNEE